MKIRTTLAKLTNSELEECLAWVVTGEQDADHDEILAPAPLIDGEVVPSQIGHVWCLCRCVFKNRSKHLATALCRGDENYGPLAITVWNGSAHIPVFIPPAPAFVLEKDGPPVFASHFNLRLDEVFPMDVFVVPRFATAPKQRSVRLDTTGSVPIQGDVSS